MYILMVAVKQGSIATQMTQDQNNNFYKSMVCYKKIIPHSNLFLRKEQSHGKAILHKSSENLSTISNRPRLQGDHDVLSLLG